jgi:hypothetical protein
MDSSTSQRMNFKSFYQTVYRSDHRHPVNIALHIIGVFAGIGLILASLTVWPFWAALGFPIAHVGPGLIGHRFFDRDEAIGDMRLTRTDVPLWWFIIANHLMAMRVLTLRW